MAVDLPSMATSPKGRPQGSRALRRCAARTWRRRLFLSADGSICAAVVRNVVSGTRRAMPRRRRIGTDISAVSASASAKLGQPREHGQQRDPHEQTDLFPAPTSTLARVGQCIETRLGQPGLEQTRYPSQSSLIYRQRSAPLCLQAASTEIIFVAGLACGSLDSPGSATNETRRSSSGCALAAPAPFGSLPPDCRAQRSPGTALTLIRPRSFQPVVSSHRRGAETQGSSSGGGQGSSSRQPSK